VTASQDPYARDLDATPSAAADAVTPAAAEGRVVDTHGLGLRRFAARGIILNSLFDLGLGGVNLARGIVLAALLTRADFGLWGILLVSLGVVAQLKVIGISDKYIQQNDADQQLAFQRAFTLELISAVVTMLLLIALVPVIALVYGRWQVLAPGLALCAMLIAYAFQSPQWIFYRRMDFLHQRLQAAVEPVVGLIVAVSLAIAGLGYWALVAGALAGAWAGALVAVVMSPYPLALRFDRTAVKVYWRFSGPILVATLCSVMLANGTVLATNFHLGLRAVGAVALATTVISFATRVDDIVATTVYPGICAVADRIDLLRESFVKTNRLAMLWAIPFGIGLTLFAPELIHYVLGAKWRSATSLIQITGLVAALNHIGFNWDDYYRARGETRPVAVVAVASVIVTLGAGIPLLLADGLTGLAWGIGAGAAAALVVRSVYIAALFDGFDLMLHAWRALIPVIPATAVVLAIRALSNEGLGLALAEFAAYIAVVIGASAVSERALLREAVGYLRGGSVRLEAA
jgi:O-antigen/teichoic acid export membrane protein